MKKAASYTLLLVFMQLFFIAVCAQQKMAGDPVERANKITQWMKIYLNLSANQLLLVRDINIGCARQIQGSLNGSQTREQKMAAIRINEQERDDELRTVLTQDQFRTWLSKKKQFLVKWQDTIKEKARDL